MQQFTVTGMTCQHCVRAVTQAITEQDPKASVQVDLEKGQVAVDSQLPVPMLVGLIAAEGYVAQPL
jgi:copper chaperone